MIDKIIGKVIVLNLVVLFCYQNLYAQGQIEIIKAFQRNDFGFVDKNSSFPFKIENFGNDRILYSGSNQRKIIIKKCIEIVTIESLTSGKIIKESNSKYILNIIEKSDSGNVEAESSLIFYFKKVKGKYKLNKIILSG